MQIQRKDVMYGEISRHNPVTMRVKPGEVFQVETELCSGGWLKSPDDVYHPDKAGVANASSGCIYVEGAKPGDMLKIDIVDIAIDKVGYCGWEPGHNPFPDWIREKEWGSVTKTVRVEDGFVIWGGGLKIPVKPMIGVLAVAPALGCPVTPDLGEFGGNMDIQEITVGNTVYLPVFVEGGLLHMGDVHALQGDGEICGSAVEVASVCTLRAEVLPKPSRMVFPRLEGEDWIATVGIARPLEDAFRIAVKELVNWMADEYGFTQPDALLLAGQVMEARCTQLVDPKYTYVAKIDKKYLKPSNDAIIY